MEILIIHAGPVTAYAHRVNVLALYAILKTT